MPRPAPGTDPDDAYRHVHARAIRAEGKVKVLRHQVETLTAQNRELRNLVRTALTTTGERP